MSILRFTAHDHKYTTIDNQEEEWLSVTSLIGQFKQPFDANKMAEKSSKNKKSKWYGMTPEAIKDAWKAEANRATTLGTWYHNEREKDLCSFDTIERHDISIPIYKPIEIEGVKYSPNQKIGDGVYPEHLVYLRSAGLCGQSDLVEVIDSEVFITDYKTNKEIKTEGFTSWDGITQKLASPLSHLDDCNYIHYALQLSVYMYIIIKHNPKLKPGKMFLHHILFEEAGKDKYGNPIAALDSNGDPIVEHVIPYEVPYLKSEVIKIIHWLEDNKHKLKPKH
jgi:hypothetical protein